MKNILFDPLYLVALGIIFFAIAYIDLNTIAPTVWQNWFSYMRWWGQLSVILFLLDFVWIILTNTVIKR